MLVLLSFLTLALSQTSNTVLMCGGGGDGVSPDPLSIWLTLSDDSTPHLTGFRAFLFMSSLTDPSTYQFMGSRVAMAGSGMNGAFFFDGIIPLDRTSVYILPLKDSSPWAPSSGGPQIPGDPSMPSPASGIPSALINLAVASATSDRVSPDPPSCSNAGVLGGKALTHAQIMESVSMALEAFPLPSPITPSPPLGTPNAVATINGASSTSSASFLALLSPLLFSLLLTAYAR